MRTDPCKQCGSIDFYSYGKFSYCRPCHNAACKRYNENKKIGNKPETLKGPSRSLGELMAISNKTKLTCSKGHPYSGDNVRRSSQRNGRHLRRDCRTCERNAKRIKYGLAPEPLPAKLSDLLDN